MFGMTVNCFFKENAVCIASVPLFNQKVEGRRVWLCVFHSLAVNFPLIYAQQFYLRP